MLALPLSPLPQVQAALLPTQEAVNRLWRPINA